MLEPVFVLQAVPADAVGFAWFAPTAQQKPEPGAAFRRYTVSTYTANFDQYHGQTLPIAPALRPLADGRVILATEFVPRADPPQAFDLCLATARS